MFVVQVLWSLAQNCQALILFLGPNFTPQSEAILLQYVCTVTNYAYLNQLDTLTWDQEKELELGISGPSSKGYVQRPCTVKC